jgi:hypothetical protein
MNLTTDSKHKPCLKESAKGKVMRNMNYQSIIFMLEYLRIYLRCLKIYALLSLCCMSHISHGWEQSFFKKRNTLLRLDTLSYLHGAQTYKLYFRHSSQKQNFP